MAIFNEFPQTNFHELNLDWIIARVKEWLAIAENWELWKNDTQAAFDALTAYVHDYFDNLDISDEIDDVIQRMFEDGTFDDIFNKAVAQNINANMIFSKFYPYTEGAAFPNGSCYLGNGYFAFYLASDTNIGKLVITELFTGNEIANVNMPLKHGNSLTYNPENKMIYACGLFNAGSGTVIIPDIITVDVTDPQNPVIGETITPPLPEDSQGIYALSYDIAEHEFVAICKSSPTGNLNIGQVDRLVIYNEDLTEIKRITFMQNAIILGTQGVQSAHNGVAYINHCDYDFIGIAAYDTTTGRRISVYSLPRILNGYRNIGEFESQFYDYDNNSWYGVSALYGSGVSGYLGISVFEMGITKSLPNYEIHNRSYFLNGTKRVTITVNNGAAGVPTDITTMPCLMDAITVCKTAGVEGDIRLASGGIDVGSVDIVDYTGSISGVSSAHAQFVGATRIIGCRINLLYIDFTGTVTHPQLTAYTGNLAVFNSIIDFVLCTFANSMLISDSIVTSITNTMVLHATKCIISGNGKNTNSTYQYTGVIQWTT